MGDRANVYVHEDTEPGVYLYTHWDGSDLPAIVARALGCGRRRWNDTPYLTRIIFSEMLKGDSDGLNGSTGYGISAEVQDGDDRIVDVDVTSQKVTVTGYGEEKKRSFGEFAS